MNNTVTKVTVVTEMRGGVGVYARNLIQGLMASGLHVTVVTPQPTSAPGDTIVNVRQIDGRGRFLKQSREFAHSISAMDLTTDIIHVLDARYARSIRTENAPIVGTMNDYFYANTRWLNTTPERRIYNDWRVRHVYYNILRNLERPALRRLDGVLCIAEQVRSVLHDEYQIPLEDLVRVPYGINFPDVARVPLNAREPYVFFAGGNFQRKGLGTLVDAAPAIVRQIPTIKFVIAGDSRDASLIKRKIRQRGLSARFEFLGQISYEELFFHYSHCTVFTMPSLLEAFGIPFLEAMYCGTPVVASDCPGPTDYLVSRKNCLMPTAGDHVQLGQAIIEAITNQTLRSELSRNGIVTATSATTEKMINRTISAYEGFRSNWLSEKR